MHTRIFENTLMISRVAMSLCSGAPIHSVTVLRFGTRVVPMLDRTLNSPRYSKAVHKPHSLCSWVVLILRIATALLLMVGVRSQGADTQLSISRLLSHMDRLACRARGRVLRV